MSLTQAQAVRLAIESMCAGETTRFRDANLAERLGATVPAAVKAAQRRRRLVEAMVTLSEVSKAEQSRGKQRA